MRRVSLKQLIRHVNVEPLEAAGHYLGHSVNLGWGRVYGGQTMAQGLAAAQQAAGPGRSVHHFGCHFLRGGDTKLPIHFETNELTKGRSFSTVHVRALQDDTPILAMTASFQVPEDGLEHQPSGGLLAEWGRPDDLKSLSELVKPHLEKIPERMRTMYSEEGTPLDLRPAGELVLPWDPAQREPRKAVVRARGPAARAPRNGRGGAPRRRGAALSPRLLRTAAAEAAEAPLLLLIHASLLTRRPTAPVPFRVIS